VAAVIVPVVVDLACIRFVFCLGNIGEWLTACRRVLPCTLGERPLVW
jgi:hypothetical protein